jgi:hypothetical protein
MQISKYIPITKTPPPYERWGFEISLWEPSHGYPLASIFIFYRGKNRGKVV